MCFFYVISGLFLLLFILCNSIVFKMSFHFIYLFVLCFVPDVFLYHSWTNWALCKFRRILNLPWCQFCLLNDTNFPFQNVMCIRRGQKEHFPVIILWHFRVIILLAWLTLITLKHSVYIFKSNAYFLYILVGFSNPQILASIPILLLLTRGSIVSYHYYLVYIYEEKEK